MRFFADPESVVLGLNEEAHVEVEVGRLAATRRNPVHVDVEDGVVERSHVEPGFFARLAQCDRNGIGVSVAVTTGVQPAPELAMVRKEHAVARHVHEPRRARDVAGPAGTLETVGVGVDEGIEACDGRRLLRPSPAICGEECFQSAAVHGTRRRGAVLALMRIIDPTRLVHTPDRAYDGNARVPGAARAHAAAGCWCGCWRCRRRTRADGRSVLVQPSCTRRLRREPLRICSPCRFDDGPWQAPRWRRQRPLRVVRPQIQPWRPAVLSTVVPHYHSCQLVD